MATSTAGFTTERVQVGPTELYLLKGGEGPPCLVLHGFEGHEGWHPFHDALSKYATVYVPSHPGYGHTPAPPWITAVWHQAVFYQWFLQQLDLKQVTLVGAGVGGWIASYMAVMCAERLRKLVLISPAGIKPEQGETVDIFIEPWRDVIRRGFSSQEGYDRVYAEAPIADFGGIRESGRVMSMRMFFRPYLYDPSLPEMLGKVRVPTLIVQGDDDRIMPAECADQFGRVIRGARVERTASCGYFAHLDQPQQVSKLVREFNP